MSTDILIYWYGVANRQAGFALAKISDLTEEPCFWREVYDRRCRQARKLHRRIRSRND